MKNLMLCCDKRIIWKWDHGCVGWESYKKVTFIFYVEEEKWNTRNKQVDWNLKFKIEVGPKIFETGERTVENCWLIGKLMEDQHLHLLMCCPIQMMSALSSYMFCSYWLRLQSQLSPGLSKNFPCFRCHFTQKYIGIIWRFLPTLNLSSFGWISKVMSRGLDSIWNESKSHEQSPTQWIKQNQLCSQSWRVSFCIFHTSYYFFLPFVSFNKAVRLYVISVNSLNLTFETTWSQIDLDRANLRDCLV